MCNHDDIAAKVVTVRSGRRYCTRIGLSCKNCGAPMEIKSASSGDGTNTALIFSEPSSRVSVVPYANVAPLLCPVRRVRA